MKKIIMTMFMVLIMAGVGLADDDLCQGGTPYSAGGTVLEAISRTFDDDVGTYGSLQGGFSINPYIGYDLGSPTSVNQLRYYWINVWPPGSTTAKWQGCTSQASGCTDLSGALEEMDSGWNEVNLGTPVTYRYYRIISNQGSGDEYFMITEMELYGESGADNGETCSADGDCTSENCDTDFDTATDYCHATASSCVDFSMGSPWERADGYELCSGNSWYKSCSSGTWGSQQNCDTTNDYCDAGGGAQSGYDLAETCSSGASGGCQATSCTSCEPYMADSETECKASCTSNDDCWSNYACSSGSCITPPSYSNFDDDDTTNFSEVADFSSVTNLTLGITGKGKIQFPEAYSVDASSNADYDTNVIIDTGFVSVNTAALDSSFNSTATITIEGVTCPVDVITYKEGTYNTRDDIILFGGSNCEIDGVCTNKQCTAGTLTFDVSHFTGFAAGSNSNLTIQAESGAKSVNDSVEFTAEYINATSGSPISGECNISFDDAWGTWYEMDYDGTDYNYSRSFLTAGLKEYNVTCYNSSYVQLEANDSKLINNAAVPEFSLLTLAAGLLVVLAGMYIIRKK